MQWSTYKSENVQVGGHAGEFNMLKLRRSACRAAACCDISIAWYTRMNVRAYMRAVYVCIQYLLASRALIRLFRVLAYWRVPTGASGYRRRVRRRSIAWPTTGLDSWARHVPHSGGMRVRKRRDVTAAAAVAHAINRREERKDHF